MIWRRYAKHKSYGVMCYGVMAFSLLQILTFKINLK